MAEKPEAGKGKKLQVCEVAKEECEEAMTECEEAIRECEDAALSCRYLLSVCVIVIILLGSLLVYLNLPYDETNGLKNTKAYYLMPTRCVDCDIPMIRGVSTELGLDIEVVTSDSVVYPSLLVISGNRSTLGVVKSRVNVLAVLCEFTQAEKACVLWNDSGEIRNAVECLQNHNISGNTVIFYTQEGCDHCDDMESWMRELKKEGFMFYIIDVDEDEAQIADECLGDILDLEGSVPQFACPALGLNRVGAVTSLNDLRAFAENCQNA